MSSIILAVLTDIHALFPAKWTEDTGSFAACTGYDHGRGWSSDFARTEAIVGRKAAPKVIEEAIKVIAQRGKARFIMDEVNGQYWAVHLMDEEGFNWIKEFVTFFSAE